MSAFYHSFSTVSYTLIQIALDYYKAIIFQGKILENTRKDA